MENLTRKNQPVGAKNRAPGKFFLTLFLCLVSVAQVLGFAPEKRDYTKFFAPDRRDGGVGGLLYSLRGGNPSYNHYNHRGDVISKTDAGSVTTWSATYGASGGILDEIGSTLDRQKHSTKEQDPTGLMYFHNRMYDPETGTFTTPDPAGFVDGTNLYAYVGQNPWSKFDPLGLATRMIGNVPIADDMLHQIPYCVMRDANLHPEIARVIDAARLKSAFPHGGAAHYLYNQILQEQVPQIAAQMAKEGLDPTMAAKLVQGPEAEKRAMELIKRAVDQSTDEYVRWFNEASQTLTQEQLAAQGAIKEYEYRMARGMVIKPRLISRLRDAAAMGEKVSDEIAQLIESKPRGRFGAKAGRVVAYGLFGFLFLYDPGEALAGSLGPVGTFADGTVAGYLKSQLIWTNDPVQRLHLYEAILNEGRFGGSLEEDQYTEYEFLKSELNLYLEAQEIVQGHP